MGEEADSPEFKGPVVGSVPFIYLEDIIVEVTSSMAGRGRFIIGDHFQGCLCMSEGISG